MSTILSLYSWCLTGDFVTQSASSHPASALFGACSRCCISSQSHSFEIQLIDTVNRLRTKHQDIDIETGFTVQKCVSISITSREVVEVVRS